MATAYNPFAKRSEFDKRSLIAYKVLTTISWLLVVVTALFYTFNQPEDCRHNHRCHTIWGQNHHLHTPFSLNHVVTSIYWIVLLIMQGGYIWHLFSANETFVTSAANVGSHFIFNNLLTFGFIMLWVRGHFWPGELLLIINFFNLTLLYFRHPTTPRFVHIPVVSAPLAWTFVAIFWDGAAMVNAHSLPARILANIVIWGILVFGAFFILTFKDYTMGFELAILSLSLALAQLSTHVIAFQWIFAFVIMGCLFILSLLVGIPGMFGQRTNIRQEGSVVENEQERRPLLEDA